MNGKKQSRKSTKYQVLEQLGSGAYGTVYKAQLKSDSDVMSDQQLQKIGYYALKEIKLEKPEEGIPSTAIREISILKELKHPNIVKLYQVITQPTALTLVFEHLECDLKKYINGIPKDKGMDPSVLKSLCYQLLKGVRYCHSKNVLHRDLKPQNLLLSKKNCLKIADFGLARGFGILTKGFTHQVVTLWYRSPDVLLQHKDYEKEIDMWSIGCIFAEMASLRPLFPGANEEDQLQKIFKLMGVPTEAKWPGVTLLPGWKKHQQLISKEKQKYQKSEISLQDYIPRLDPKGIDLLKRMLQPNPKKRILTDEALGHPYFENLDENVRKMYAPALKIKHSSK